MTREQLKEIVIEALAEFAGTKQGEQVLGQIVFKAVRQALVYEIELERTHPDGAVEVVKESGDILSFIADWIKKSEGAIRGCQSDAAQARNRAGQARSVVQDLVVAIERAAKNGGAAEIPARPGPEPKPGPDPKELSPAGAAIDGGD